MNGKNENMKLQIDTKNRDIMEIKKIHEQNLNSVLYEKANLENKLNMLKSRKLSWGERFSGKLNLNQDGTQ